MTTLDALDTYMLMTRNNKGFERLECYPIISKLLRNGEKAQWMEHLLNEQAQGLEFSFPALI